MNFSTFIQIPTEMKKLLLLSFLIFNFTRSFSQAPADVEMTFGLYPGFNGKVHKIISQPDGKLLVGGYFTKYKGYDCAYLARLNPDGNIDTSFNTGQTGLNGIVNVITLQPNGKILVAGLFNMFHGVSAPRLLRLNSDGSRDTSFDPGTAFAYNQGASDIALQQDSKIVIGGSFTSFNGLPTGNLVRLNTDGSVDFTFNVSGGFNDSVRQITQQPDGKLILVGAFTYYAGYTRNRIIRLNDDGNIDTTFAIGLGFEGTPVKTLVLPDGKIIVCGFFYKYRNTNEYGLIRLNDDGTKDTSFNIGTAFQAVGNNPTNAFLDAEGKLIIAGYISTFNETVVNRNVIRCNTDGTLDSSFMPLHANNVEACNLQNDGKIVVAGNYYIERIDQNGTTDTSFDFGSGFDDQVDATLIQPDGKMVVGGSFSLYNRQRELGLIRLNADGSKDHAFNLDYITLGQTKRLLLQPDGKIIALGTYIFADSQNGQYFNLIRLNPDGSRDSSFTLTVYNTSQISAIALQPDGKILLGGVNMLTTVNNATINLTQGLIRLNSNGTYDGTFNLGAGFNSGMLDAIQVQPDGKIIATGPFTVFNGEPHQHIIRLMSDGTVDPGFNTGEGLNANGWAIALQPDGKILVGGYFSSYNVTPAQGILRLNTNGSLDTSFNPGAVIQGVRSIALQTDGKIIAGGQKAVVQTTQLNSLARFNTDGTQDNSFDVGTDVSGETNSGSYILSLGIQTDGKVLVGGRFLTYNGVNTPMLVRLEGGTALSTDNVETSQALLYPNPVQDLLHIQMSQNTNLKAIGVYDLTGKRMLQNHDRNLIDVHTLNSGMYIVKVQTANDESVSMKFIKK